MLDVLVIGSGPAGLSAAVYAKRANMSVLVVEKEFGGSGQIAESTHVDNYLGFAGIDGFELGEKFRNHAACLGVEIKEAKACDFAFQTKAPSASEPPASFWRVTFAQRL